MTNHKSAILYNKGGDEIHLLGQYKLKTFRSTKDFSIIIKEDI